MITNRKVWVKPTVEVAPIKMAKAGGFSTSDTSHTHRS